MAEGITKPAYELLQKYRFEVENNDTIQAKCLQMVNYGESARPFRRNRGIYLRRKQATTKHRS